MGIYFESGAEMTMGTFPLKADELKNAVRLAYETGFRSFDTAQMYQNEADLGAALVRAGLALAYRQYSSTYGADEDSAKTAKLGMWSGAFTAPWAWRRSQ